MVEIFIKKGGRCRYTTIQNWSSNVCNLVTKRAFVEEEGVMEWVDGNLGGRTSILSDKIYEDYNSEKDLSFGWSPHNYEKNPYFDGCLYSTKIIDEVFLEQKQQSVLYGINNSIVIPIIGNGNITSVRVMISK